MQDVTDSFTYPTEREDWLKTIGIGGALLVFSFLLVPLLAVYGYLVRVVRASLADAAEPPVFDDWEGLLVDGLKAWVIGLAYMLVPLLVAGVTVSGSILAIATGSEAGAAAGIAGLLGGLALSVLLSLVFGYVAVAALLNFAAEGSLGAAFDFDALADVLLDTDFVISWPVSVLVFLVVGVVASALSAVPIVGSIVAAFPTFYAMVVVADVLADGFDAARTPSEDAEAGRTGEMAV